jgi:Mn2+/Fe2+ NRAMP family transporter
MAKTGAEHGMELFWALVLSCVFTFVLMVAYGKVTLVSGKTALLTSKTNSVRLDAGVYIMIAFSLRTLR